MQMSSISIFAGGSAVIAPLAVFLRYLLKQSPKVASTSQELLDLFEDRCTLLEEHPPLTSPNEVSERFTVAASNELVPVNASSTELSTSAEAYLVYRIQPARGLHKKQTTMGEPVRSVLSPPPRKRQAQCRLRTSMVDNEKNTAFSNKVSLVAVFGSMDFIELLPTLQSR